MVCGQPVHAKLFDSQSKLEYFENDARIKSEANTGAAAAA